MFGVMAPVVMKEAKEATVRLPKSTSITALPKSTSISGTATIKQGGNKLMSKLFGTKSTSSTSKENSIDEREQSEESQASEEPKHSKELETFEENNQQSYEHQMDESPTGLIKPCPFIRPLEHKLQARTEPMPRPRAKTISTRSIDTHSTDSSAFAIAMNREEAHQILNNKAAEDMARSVSEMSMTDVGGVPGAPTVENVITASTTQIEGKVEAEDDMEMQISLQLEFVAVNSAQGSESVHHWRYYIECYSKGQFNLNAPPQPPPRSSGFDYLPAVFPPQEEKRMAVGSSFDIVWPHWSRDKTGALIHAAMSEFGTKSASLSFFDSKYEVFKAEQGYDTSRISRSMSIGAHALLSEDVFVVLDAKQDWRFEGNPLVYGHPKIRFFAASPMLSSDGHPVGIFAIFSREPRTSFTAAQRRELACYSAMALTDLTQQAKWLLDFELRSPRSTPLLQRDSAINSNYKQPSVKSPTQIQIDHALVPPSLRYHKMKTPPANTSNSFPNRQVNLDSSSEQTPPSSSEGSEDNSFPRRPRGFGKNPKQLSVNSDLNDYASSEDMITPDSEDFRGPTPRPFSASDLTSLNPQPPNTPILRSQEPSMYVNSDLTVENFMSLSDDDCAEGDSPLIDLSTPEDKSNQSRVGTRHSLAPPPSLRLTMSSISTMMTAESQRVKDPMAEAAFSCSFSAQNLGYDLIYVVDIKPSRPHMTDKELFAPGGLQKRIVVAYGLDRPMELATELHINTIRSRGAQVYENPLATYDNSEFVSGYLLPLQTETGPHRKRSSGLIFGAFKRPKLVEVGPPEQITALDMKKLMNAADTLKSILFKQQQSPHRLPKRANTEPTSQDRYPANEAVEIQVGRYSLANNGFSTPNRYIVHEGPEVEKRIQDESAYRYPVNETAASRRHLLDETSQRDLTEEAAEVQVERSSITETGRSTPNPYFAIEADEVVNGFLEEPAYRYPANDAVPAGRTHLEDAPVIYSSHELAQGAKFSLDSGISSTASASASPERRPAKKLVTLKETGKSEPTSPEKKLFSFMEAMKLEKAGKSEPASPDRKPSRDITTSKKSGKSAPASPDRKASKESKRAAKAAKAEKYSIDAGMDRPFHAINRFRPF